MENKDIRVYVGVKADFSSEGKLIPKSVIWEDGKTFEIDRVTEIKQGHGAKAGGQGDRYTIFVNGVQTYLFFERNSDIVGNNLGRWFVERRI